MGCFSLEGYGLIVPARHLHLKLPNASENMFKEGVLADMTEIGMQHPYADNASTNSLEQRPGHEYSVVDLLDPC